MVVIGRKDLNFKMSDSDLGILHTILRFGVAEVELLSMYYDGNSRRSLIARLKRMEHEGYIRIKKVGYRVEKGGGIKNLYFMRSKGVELLTGLKNVRPPYVRSEDFGVWCSAGSLLRELLDLGVLKDPEVFFTSRQLKERSSETMKMMGSTLPRKVEAYEKWTPFHAVLDDGKSRKVYVFFANYPMLEPEDSSDVEVKRNIANILRFAENLRVYGEREDLYVIVTPREYIRTNLKALLRKSPNNENIYLLPPDEAARQIGVIWSRPTYYLDQIARVYGHICATPSEPGAMFTHIVTLQNKKKRYIAELVTGNLWQYRAVQEYIGKVVVEVVCREEDVGINNNPKIIYKPVRGWSDEQGKDAIR